MTALPVTSTSSIERSADVNRHGPRCDDAGYGYFLLPYLREPSALVIESESDGSRKSWVALRAVDSGLRVLVTSELYGPPDLDDPERGMRMLQNVDGFTAGDHGYLACVCPWCGAAGFELDGCGARVCGPARHGLPRGEDKTHTFTHPRILSAYSAALRSQLPHRATGAEMAEALR